MTTTTERPRSAAGSDFAALNRRITAEGLMERRPGYYAVRLTAVALLLIGGWAAFVLVGASWWSVAIAAVLAVAYAQTALVAHDLAHRQVFRTNRPSAFAGRIAGNLGIGMSYGFSMDKHTKHHNNPNHDDLDPDVKPELLIWASESAVGRRGLAAFVTRHQAGLFFPLLTLLGIDLRVSSVKALLTPGMKHRGLEAALLIVHGAAYLGALLLVLSPLQALVFFVVHQGLFGVYLGMTFAPNHKGMPHPTGNEDYLRKQVVTARNVKGGRLMNVALGGLNYQIEHHLFPAMPSPNLGRAQVIVEQYCDELGVPYEQTGLIESYRQALRHLHEVGAPLRESR